MFKLPFKPGDDMWYIDDATLEIKCEKGGIAGIAFMADGEIKIVNRDGLVFSIGEEDVFPSYEMALARQKTNRVSTSTAVRRRRKYFFISAASLRYVDGLHAQRHGQPAGEGSGQATVEVLGAQGIGHGIPALGQGAGQSGDVHLIPGAGLDAV